MNPSGEVHLLAAAPLHWSAGFDYVLLAMRLLADRDVPARLRVEGDGPDRERFLFNVHDLDLAGAVELSAGPTHDRERQVLVLGAVDDRPWPTTAAALTRAGSVVTTDLPWLREHVGEAGREVRWVLPRDPDALASAIVDVVSATLGR